MAVRLGPIGYVPDPAHTNSVECVWDTLEHNIHRIWHHVSKGHLVRYIDESALRLNESNCNFRTLVRMITFAHHAAQHRISSRGFIVSSARARESRPRARRQGVVEDQNDNA